MPPGCAQQSHTPVVKLVGGPALTSSSSPPSAPFFVSPAPASAIGCGQFVQVRAATERLGRSPGFHSLQPRHAIDLRIFRIFIRAIDKEKLAAFLINSADIRQIRCNLTFRRCRDPCVFAAFCRTRHDFTTSKTSRASSHLSPVNRDPPRRLSASAVPFLDGDSPTRARGPPPPR